MISKTKMLIVIKKWLILVIIQLSQILRWFDDSNKLVVLRVEDETKGVAIEEIFGLKPKIYSFLMNNSSEHKKTKGVNENIVTSVSRSE